MRQRIKNALCEVHLDDFSRFALWRSQLLYRSIRGTDARLTNAYFGTTDVPKLHIGSGPHLLAGWLNTDIDAHSKNTVFLDATRRFPFGNETFQYIFSEHMIEHISYHNASHMLGECYRVLRPSGTIRLVTPNLRFLIDFFQPSLSATQERYLDWARQSIPNGNPCTPTSLVNNFVRAWGHQFIYDESTLRASVANAGFQDITFTGIGTSEDPVLRGLENAARMPDGLLAFESIVCEAKK